MVAEGYVEPLPSGRFRAQVSIAGKRVRLGIHKTESEARAEVDKALGREPTPTLASFGERVLEARMRFVKGSSAERSRWDRHVLPRAIAKLELSAITSADIVLWIRELEKLEAGDPRGQKNPRRISPITVRKIVSLVSCVLEEARLQNKIPANPTRGVVVRAAKKKPAWTVLDPGEQKLVRDSKEIPESDKLPILVAIGSGLRQGEQWALKLQDVDVNCADPFIDVKDSKSGEPRRVELFGIALEAMRRWLEILPKFAPHNPRRLVFPTAYGTSRPVGKLLGTHKYFGELLRRAGIQRHVRWHDLRHTCAASLVSGWWGHAWTMRAIQKFLGHASVTTTEIYAHLGETETKRAARETKGF